MASKNKSGRSKKESPDGTELLVLELQEIHSAESQLARVLPRLVKAVESEKLQEILELRLEQGERLIGEIEAALDEMEETPGRKKNVAAEGLINDAREHVQEIAPGPALDAVLIGAVQKTEHYCIAAWGTSKSLAQATGQKTVVSSMERALKEGKAMDEQLTQLAEKEITPALLTGESDEEQEDTDSGSSGRSRKSGGSERRVTG
jgi:ferritin-like metal-binding protein YciE